MFICINFIRLIARTRIPFKLNCICSHYSGNLNSCYPIFSLQCRKSIKTLQVQELNYSLTIFGHLLQYLLLRFKGTPRTRTAPTFSTTPTISTTATTVPTTVTTPTTPTTSGTVLYTNISVWLKHNFHSSLFANMFSFFSAVVVAHWLLPFLLLLLSFYMVVDFLR